MAGLRIHHPTLSSCTLLVPHPGDSRTGRRPKDYYIHLDANGDALISDTVWMRLQQARASGLSPHQFIVLNEVKDPPTIVMRKDVMPGHEPDTVRAYRQAVDGATIDAQMKTALQELAPKGIKPRITTHKVKGAQ